MEKISLENEIKNCNKEIENNKNKVEKLKNEIKILEENNKKIFANLKIFEKLRVKEEKIYTEIYKKIEEMKANKL